MTTFTYIGTLFAQGCLYLVVDPCSCNTHGHRHMPSDTGMSSRLDVLYNSIVAGKQQPATRWLRCWQPLQDLADHCHSRTSRWRCGVDNKGRSHSYGPAGRQHNALTNCDLRQDRIAKMLGMNVQVPKASKRSCQRGETSHATPRAIR